MKTTTRIEDDRINVHLSFAASRCEAGEGTKPWTTCRMSLLAAIVDVAAGINSISFYSDDEFMYATITARAGLIVFFFSSFFSFIFLVAVGFFFHLVSPSSSAVPCPRTKMCPIILLSLPNGLLHYINDVFNACQRCSRNNCLCCFAVTVVIVAARRFSLRSLFSIIIMGFVICRHWEVE